nr:MAG TPA: hypothetical protein [Caudoviricetes sp.]
MVYLPTNSFYSGAFGRSLLETRLQHSRRRV